MAQSAKAATVVCLAGPPLLRKIFRCPLGVDGARLQARDSVSSLPRSSSIAGLAMPSTPGVASALSHIWLIVGVAAAVNLASALLPSGVSLVARLLTSFNCAVAS